MTPPVGKQRRVTAVTVTLTVAELAYALGVLGARGGTNSMKTNAAKAKALDEAERAYLAYKKAERAYKEAWRACKEEQGEPARRRRGDAT